MKPQIVFFTELLGPSLIINLAQLVPPSVALLVELVTCFVFYVWCCTVSILGIFRLAGMATTTLSAAVTLSKTLGRRN